MSAFNDYDLLVEGSFTVKKKKEKGTLWREIIVNNEERLQVGYGKSL